MELVGSGAKVPDGVELSVVEGLGFKVCVLEGETV